MLVDESVYSELMNLKSLIDTYEKKTKSKVECVVMHVLDTNPSNEDLNKVCYLIECSMFSYLSMMFNRLIMFKVVDAKDEIGSQYTLLNHKQFEKFKKTKEWKLTWHK